MTKNTFIAEVTFKGQLYKMVKHTQTIHQQQPTNCLRAFDQCSFLTNASQCSAPNVADYSKALTHFSPVLHFIQKPNIWFPLQIKWLVSIWNVTLVWNRFKINRNIGTIWATYSSKSFSKPRIKTLNPSPEFARSQQQKHLTKVTNQLTFTCSESTIKTLEKGWNVFKVNNKVTRTMSQPSSFFIVNFEHISHLFSVFLLFTLNK